MSDIIANREHPKLSEKRNIYKLLSDSYRGGDTYKRGSHLMQYSIREPRNQFLDRQERAIYINTIRPILDILVSFIFNDKQERNYPPALDFLKEKTNGQRGMKSFMRNLATHSGMYTSGVLVDSPSQSETEGVNSLADQQRLGLQPYAKIYTPDKIRDFWHDDRGELEWVLLDDSIADKSDPTIAESKKEIYTLWTKTEFTKFERRLNVSYGTGATNIRETVVLEKSSHPVGYVPFRIVNWREIDDDYIADTPFETAAQISKQIYNVMSYLDEMLAGGTFKTLFYPANSPKDIPSEMQQFGSSGSVAINFPMTASHPPYFAGQGLSDTEQFVSAINFYIKQIQAIFGMDEDRDKKFIQSGVAKSLEFSKSDALLSSAAEELEKTEEWIVRTSGRYLNIQDADVKVVYQKEYQSEEIEQQIARVMQLTMSPFDTMSKESWKYVAKNVLAHLDDKTMNKLIKEIESQDDAVKQEEIQLKAEQMAQEEIDTRQAEDDKNSKQNKQQPNADESGNNAR